MPLLLLGRSRDSHKPDLNSGVGGLAAPIWTLIHCIFSLEVTAATLHAISASDFWPLLDADTFLASATKQASAEVIISESQSALLASTAYMCGYTGDSVALDDLLLVADDGLDVPGAVPPFSETASCGSFICSLWSMRLEAMSCRTLQMFNIVSVPRAQAQSALSSDTEIHSCVLMQLVVNIGNSDIHALRPYMPQHIGAHMSLPHMASVKPSCVVLTRLPFQQCKHPDGHQQNPYRLTIATGVMRASIELRRLELDLPGAKHTCV